jgi:uncharacterized protein YdgA (DUF945 family)
MQTRTLAAALAAGIVLAGAALWTGTSWYAGARLAREFNTLPEQMAHHGLEVKPLDFQRGLFSSVAKTAWRWPALEDEAEPLWLHFEHHIQHRLSLGGTLGKMQSHLVLDEPTRQTLNLAADQSPLDIDSILTWDGAQTHRLEGIPFAGTLEGWSVQWEGLKGHVRVSDENRRFDASIHMPAAQLAHESGTLTVSWSALLLEARQSSPRPYGFWTGESRLEVGDLSIGHPDIPQSWLALKAGKAHIHSELEGRLLGSEALFEAQSLALADQKGENATVKISLDGLAASAVDAFLKDLQALPKDQEAQAGRILWEHLPALLANNPELRIDPFAVRFDAGDVNAQLRLRYTGEDRLFSLRFFENLEGQLGARLPEVLVMRYLTDHARSDLQAQLRRLQIEKSPAELDTLAHEEAIRFRDRLMASGLFMEENGQWSMDLALNGGHVLTHGRALAPLLLHLLRGAF